MKSLGFVLFVAAGAALSGVCMAQGAASSSLAMPASAPAASTRAASGASASATAANQAAAATATPASETPQSASTPQPPGSVIRSTSNLVVVDVTVTQNGRPVKNLSQQTFHVFENGREQSIRFFDEHVSQEPSADQKSKAIEPEAANTYSNIPFA